MDLNDYQNQSGIELNSQCRRHSINLTEPNCPAIAIPTYLSSCLGSHCTQGLGLALRRIWNLLSQLILTLYSIMNKISIEAMINGLFMILSISQLRKLKKKIKWCRSLIKVASVIFILSLFIDAVIVIFTPGILLGPTAALSSHCRRLQTHQ